MKKKIPVKVITYIFLAFIAILVIFPIYVTFATAFKTTEESTKNFFSWPQNIYIGNFVKVMADAHFWDYIKNSFLITVISVVVTGIMIPMVSFSIARLMRKYKYFKILYFVFVLSLFAPFQVLMVPLTQLCTKLGLMNQAGIILIYCAFALGQGVFLFVGYYKSIPVELEEAAVIDGCTTTQTFFKIVFPLAKPMTMTVIILNTLWIWNDFLLPLLILNKSASNWTLPLYQYNFKSAYTFDYNLAFASFMFSIVPMIIMYICLQKNIIEGLTAGAVKS
ncbi:MAG TPA: carbohydrate ABC transporter permease [Lachnospiraceae bacterium]|nr:carbohydrate ABC transporter permease [Lachnospiraceae bacterium]